MPTKEFNIAVFESTMKAIDSSPSIKKDIDNAIAAQKYYFGDVPAPMADRFDTPCSISLTRNRTVDAGRAVLKADSTVKVAILNFASATRPGGGVTTGSSAQEECICRVSGLYKCLTTPEAVNRFYEHHKKNVGPLHNDDIIYTPNVPVLKTDDYDMLDDTVYLDVITCAAPNLREKNVSQYNQERELAPDISDDELYDIHVSRARQILNAAAANGAEVVILGAFGCGAFRNKPEVVAKAYAAVVPEYAKQFKKIEFAIYCPKGKPTDNYDAFKSVFGRK